MNLIQADETDRVVERKEVPLFDNKAFREAVINAVLHNKWVEGNEPMISVFSDRIEILSRGTFAPAQTMEGFFLGESIPVNEKLSEIFLQLHISEKSGRGVPKITEMYGKDAFSFRENSIVVRAIYEFVEDKEELFLQFVPGRVFSEYQIPSEAYNCIKLYKDDIYEILFGNANYIDNLCKRSLVNICESEYVRDWTQRISYLFDTFDGIDPRNYNKEKVIKLVFTILAIDKADYLRNKQKYEQLKNKYRNPILHGGKSIFEIEPDINEIKKVDTYLRKTIMDYCLKIHSLSISTWEELDNAYRVQQNFLKL